MGFGNLNPTQNKVEQSERPANSNGLLTAESGLMKGFKSRKAMKILRLLSAVTAFSLGVAANSYAGNTQTEKANMTDEAIANHIDRIAQMENDSRFVNSIQIEMIAGGNWTRLLHVLSGKQPGEFMTATEAKKIYKKVEGVLLGKYADKNKDGKSSAMELNKVMDEMNSNPAMAAFVTLGDKINAAEDNGEGKTTLFSY